MNSTTRTIAATMVGCGALFITLAIPLVRGRVAPNHWYGFRLEQSFRSAAAWYAINRYGARQLIGWSIPLVLGGLGLAVFDVPLDRAAPLTTALALSPGAVALGATAASYRYAKRFDDTGH